VALFKGGSKCEVATCRGSLEVGDVLSDLSANPMELSLLGVQGKLMLVASGTCHTLIATISLPLMSPSIACMRHIA